MSSREFTEWLAYYGIEPWGEEPANLRHGIATSILANAHRDAKKQATPFKPQDFMLKFDRPPQPVMEVDDTSRWKETKSRFKALIGKK